MALVRQTTLPIALPCSNLSAWPTIAPTCARLFLLERDGHFYHCCSPDRTRLCGIPLVTIGVTNADVTSNSAVDDGAADQGMDCT